MTTPNLNKGGTRALIICRGSLDSELRGSARNPANVGSFYFRYTNTKATIQLRYTKGQNRLEKITKA